MAVSTQSRLKDAVLSTPFLDEPLEDSGHEPNKKHAHVTRHVQEHVCIRYGRRQRVALENMCRCLSLGLDVVLDIDVRVM